MPVWIVALISVALVAGVLGLSVHFAIAAVESRVLIVGFLLFFVLSVAAGAGFLPASPIDHEASDPAQSASLMRQKGNSR